MTQFTNYRTYAGYLCAAAIVTTLSACGGGGGGDDSPAGPTPVSVKGTAATGAPMSSAAIFMTCANRAVLSGNTDAQGNFATPQIAFTYPCIGTATKGSVVYRSLLLRDTTVNFTPLTDLLVEVVLASATTGSTSMTIAEFLAKVQTDTTFATNVSSPTSAATYRSGVIGVLRTLLIASGRTPAQADATLLAASTTSFESAAFVANGTGVDKVLDDTKAVTQNPDGSVATSIKAAAKAQGDTIAPPASGGTGGIGG